MYPTGTRYDPRAPWNEPVMTKCTACKGKGRHFYAYHIEQEFVKEVTEETYILLPETEEEAMRHRQHFIKWDTEECETCHGRGEVEDDNYYQY